MFKRRSPLYAKMRRKLSVLPVSLASFNKKEIEGLLFKPRACERAISKKAGFLLLVLFYRASYLFNLQGQNLANFKTLIAIANSKTINLDPKKGRSNSLQFSSFF
jgi:hypothetical protein